MAFGLTRGEVSILLGVSLVGHSALAFQVTRPRPHAQQVVGPVVSVELLRAPPVLPAVVPPQVEPPKVRPVAARHVARPAPTLAPPRISPAPSPAPTPPSVEEPPREEPGPVPEGDEPNAAVGGHGAGLPIPAPALPPAAPAAPAAPVVAAQEGANYLKNPRPGYPTLAMRRGWQGDVQLRVRVSPEGKAVSIVVQRSSGRDVLDQAAVEAVKGWTFNPARQGGVPLAGWVTVPIVFRLQQGE